MTSYELWNRYLKCYDALTKMDSYSNSMTDIATAVSPYPGARVLDAGSGTGNLSICLKHGGADVTSLDFSETALQKHREKDPHAKLIQASLEESLAFPAETFDFVCCASVLFALSKAGCRQAVREFYRVLRLGGRVVVTVASPQKRNSRLLLNHLKKIVSLKEPLEKRFRAVADMPNMAKIVYYNRILQQLPDWEGYHRFTEEELFDLLRMSGFSGIKITRTYGGSFFLATASKSTILLERDPPRMTQDVPAVRLLNSA
jgi:ubiquinone/menaquinone biosynthesis C-methylase UbiE